MKKYFLVLIALCFTFAVSAQIDRSKAPASGPAPQVNIGEYQSFTLKNGLKVLVVENNKIPKINFSLNVIRDNMLEKDKAGLTQVTGTLWGKATTNRNAKQLSEETDFIGARLNTGSAYVGISGLSKYKDQMMELMSDVILHPAFPQDEFDKIILQTQTALKSDESNPGSIMSNITDATLFGPQHPYGDIVTPATISNVTLDDCKTYYKDFIHPNNSILVIVGDITLKEAKKLTEKYLGSWPKGTAPTFTYKAPAQPKGRKVVFSNKDAATQASIKVAYPVDYKIGAPDQIAINVMNQILGGGDFQAKLLKNLREDKGYTYGAYSRISSSVLDGAGTFSASAEVKANTVDSALIETLKEMENMKKGDFSEKDVERVKKTFAGEFSRSLESPQTIADFAYSIERYGLPKDFYTTFLQKLANLTKADIETAARKYLHPENAYILVVTDRSLKPKLEKLASDGKVVELDHNGQPVKEGPKVAAGLTAEKVVASYLKALGGEAKIQGIKDMSVNSEMNVQGMTINNNYVYLINPNDPMFMITVSMAGNIMQKVIFDGQKATVSGPGGSQTIEGEKAAEMKTQAYPILEAEFDRVGIKPTLEGIEQVNGRDAYKLKMVVGDAVTYSFYDVENGLKVKSIGTQNGMTQEVTFEDYRPTAYGILYPYLSKTSMQGMPIEIKVTDVKVNTGVKASDFK